jgi:serine/threonine protein kinase
MKHPVLDPKYEILGFIASGGQADVFLLRHVVCGLRCAGKFLREHWDPIAREMFRKEAERHARVAGPHVAPLLAYDCDAPQPFMVLEFMPNGSLADEIARRPQGFGFGEALAIGAKLAEALADAHAKGVAHCDFKPGNVLHDAAGRWVLSDFGVAATVGPHEMVRAVSGVTRN